MKGKFKIIGLLAIIIIAVLFVSGCTTHPKGVGESIMPDKPGIIDYGNGVFYFRYTEENFAYALSEFIERNPDKEIKQFVGDHVYKATGSENQGYFVYCKIKST